jgi:hypothetical protein
MNSRGNSTPDPDPASRERPPVTDTADRRERLAAALRENLKKRKEQARRRELQGKPPGKTAPESA